MVKCWILGNDKSFKDALQIHIMLFRIKIFRIIRVIIPIESHTYT